MTDLELHEKAEKIYRVLDSINFKLGLLLIAVWAIVGILAEVVKRIK